MDHKISQSQKNIFCPQCGNELQVGANFCSRCAQPTQASATRQQPIPQSNKTELPEKKVGLLLGIGILFIPYVFTWFTLKGGYGKKTRILSFLWMFVVIVMVAGPYNSKKDTSKANSSMSNTDNNLAKTTSIHDVINLVKIDFKWSTTGFGNIMEADFTIINPTENAIKDIEITCTHYAKSGTKIDSNKRTVYEIVQAKEKKVFKKFNMGFIHNQASSSSCGITDLVIVE